MRDAAHGNLCASPQSKIKKFAMSRAITCL
jgi:hypothetical protein